MMLEGCIKTILQRPSQGKGMSSGRIALLWRKGHASEGPRCHAMYKAQPRRGWGCRGRRCSRATACAHQREA